MSERDAWDGRPVTFASLSIREATPVIDAFGGADGKDWRYILLVLSMRWADTGEPVFTNVDEIYGQPLRNWVRLVRLATKASFVNGLQQEDPDAASPPAANGHDGTAASPSP